MAVIKYTMELTSSTGTKIDLKDVEKILSEKWYNWKRNSMTNPKDKAQMRRDILELIEIYMLD